MEGIMNMTTNILKSLVPRETLYCVWIRTHDGESAPLIRVWIDPSMTEFEKRAEVEWQDNQSVSPNTVGE
jgi:hypothetical protein